MAFFQAMQLVGVGLQFASAMDASRAARDQAAFNVYQQKFKRVKRLIFVFLSMRLHKHRTELCLVF